MIITMYSEESTRPPEEEIVGNIFRSTDNMCGSPTTNRSEETETEILASQELERCWWSAVRWSPTQIFSSFKNPRWTKAWSCTVFSSGNPHPHLLSWITLLAWCCFWLKQCRIQNSKELLPSKPPMGPADYITNFVIFVPNWSSICLCVLTSSPPYPVLG